MCVSLGRIVVRDQEAIQSVITQIPPWQRRGRGHVHEDRQSLRCVSGVPFWARRECICILKNAINQPEASDWSVSLWSLPASPMKSPARTGKYTATRTDREVRADAWVHSSFYVDMFRALKHSDSWVTKQKDAEGHSFQQSQQPDQLTGHRRHTPKPCHVVCCFKEFCFVCLLLGLLM